MGKRAAILLCFCLLLSDAVWATVTEPESEEGASIPEEESLGLGEPVVSDVLVLDITNFTQTVEKYDFLLVEFYAPWCGHCKKLAPEFEAAATELKDHDPPIFLAKVDVDEEGNKPLASDYDVKGFPTLKVFKNKGQLVQDYKGPRETAGIVSHLKKLSGPPSIDLTSEKQAGDFLAENEKELIVVGVFDALDGEEYSNFTEVADLLRGDYVFAHTAVAAYIREDGVPLKTPSVRLYKNFDDPITVNTDFSVEGLSKWIVGESLPLVTEMSKKPEHRPALVKFFESSKEKVYLFFSGPKEGGEDKDEDEDEDEDEEDLSDALLSSFSSAAKTFKTNGLIFLFAAGEESENALQFFGLESSDVPAYVIQGDKGKKYIAKNVHPDQLTPWIEDYLGGKLKEHIKSEPIPLVNDEPVKVVVADSLQEAVINSGKDVFLEFYAPWCGHCKKLAPILDEVAVSFESDPEIVIAKFDASANDVTGDLFDVKGFPTLYMYNAKGVSTPFEGDRTKEGITEFINKYRANPVETVKLSETPDDATEEPEESKDEL